MDEGASDDNAVTLQSAHMGDIFGIPVALICVVAIIVVCVGAWALYEIGKEQGRKGK